MKRSKKYLFIGGGVIATVSVMSLIFHRGKSDSRVVRSGSLPSASGFINWYGKHTFLTTAPRGIRNNNPANLIQTNIPWNGKVPLSQNTDGRFEQFVAPEFGVRALIKDLLSDFSKGKNTVSKLIKEFAPIHENNTSAYIDSVSAFVGVSKHSKLQPSKNTLQRLVMAIDKVENGGHYITPQLFDMAYLMI